MKNMLVGAHWSFLKRLYIFSFNIPRIDLLIQIMCSKVIRKYWNEYKALLEGSKKPWWWKEFVKTWLKIGNTPIYWTYDTNNFNFTCSCPAWERNNFFLCKHLINQYQCPQYGEVSLYRSPPFLKIERGPVRLRANIDDEEHVTMSSYVDRSNLKNNSYVQLGDSNSFLPFYNEQYSKVDYERQAQISGRRVFNNINWRLQHVLELEGHPSGNAQLQYLERNIIPRIETYRRNITRENNQVGR